MFPTVESSKNVCRTFYLGSTHISWNMLFLFPHFYYSVSKGLRKTSTGFTDIKENKCVVTGQSWSKRGSFKHCQASKLTYCGQTMRSQGSCLEKEIMQGKMSGARRQGRPRMTWTDNIKTWTSLSGGASPSKQPGHFQVTKVVRQVIPFLPPSILLPPFPSLSLHFPFLPLEEGPLNTARGLGERCKLLQRGLGRSPNRNRYWCFLDLKYDIWCQQIK